VQGHAEQARFRKARDALYALPEGQERERAFGDLHVLWFDRLELGRPLSIALGEQPILAVRCRRCVVARAATARDEGADLLVAEGDGEERSILLRLRPALFRAAPALLALLRAELLHVADMLDPAFGYRPELPESEAGASHTELVRNRYRTVWNVRVAGRLDRRGVLAEEVRERAYREFSAVFPMLGPSTGDAFARFFDGEARTHDELIAFALVPGVNGDLCTGGRCPLCRLPSYAWEARPECLPAEVVGQVASDFPSWQPSQGLCRQCADLYRARDLSRRAAADLPGSERFRAL
jgi:hypothetical protein